MANGINKAILVGNLGQDPDLNFTQAGKGVCNFTLATNETWKDKEGQKQERVEWHRVVVWGAQGKACGEHLTKGSQVYVEGRLQTRDWEDKDGNKRYTTEIVAAKVNFLGTKASGGGGGGQRRDDPPPQDYDDVPF